MSADLSKVGLLTRREIEARIAGPLIKAFIRELGEEITMEITGDVIRSLTRESGSLIANSVGGNSIDHLVKTLPLWSRENAMQFEILEQNKKKIGNECNTVPVC